MSGVEPRLTALFFQYYEQTVARPWLSLWPIAAAIVGTALGSRVGVLPLGTALFFFGFATRPVVDRVILR